MPVGFSSEDIFINPPPSPRNSPRISVTLRPPRTRQSGRDSRRPKTHTSGRKRKTKVKNAKKSKRGSQKKRGRRASRRQRGGRDKQDQICKGVYKGPMEAIFNHEFRDTFYSVFKNAVNELNKVGGKSGSLPDYSKQEIVAELMSKLIKAIVDRVAEWCETNHHQLVGNIQNYLEEGLETILKPPDSKSLEYKDYGLLGNAIITQNGLLEKSPMSSNNPLTTIFDHYKNKQVSKMRCFIQKKP